jgi:formamidopyrimidine-DNA glycosylase
VPELIEVERYRRVAARVVGRRIGEVDAPDTWYLKGGVGAVMLADLLVGAVVVDARRRGKLLLVDTDRGDVLGLRFGMTGRLLLSGPAAESTGGDDPVGDLLYGPRRDHVQYHRFALGFTDGSRLTVADPRRLGGVELAPPESRLGPPAESLDAAALALALGGSTAPLKAVLMDQHRIAGLGNLLCDEALWRAGLSPLRPAGSLDDTGSEALLRAIHETVAELSARGGSHTGDLQPARAPGGGCPRCGTALAHDRVGGRSTYWCPAEQR